VVHFLGKSLKWLEKNITHTFTAISYGFTPAVLLIGTSTILMIENYLVKSIVDIFSGIWLVMLCRITLSKQQNISKGKALALTLISFNVVAIIYLLISGVFG
jgi:cobalamin biosynthesis protein CobD/CbiB